MVRVVLCNVRSATHTNKFTSTSLTNMNRYSESGSPCYRPLSILIGFKGEPLTSTETESELTRHYPLKKRIMRNYVVWVKETMFVLFS